MIYQKNFLMGKKEACAITFEEFKNRLEYNHVNYYTKKFGSLDAAFEYYNLQTKKANPDFMETPEMFAHALMVRDGDGCVILKRKKAGGMFIASADCPWDANYPKDTLTTLFYGTEEDCFEYFKQLKNESKKYYVIKDTDTSDLIGRVYEYFCKTVTCATPNIPKDCIISIWDDYKQAEDIAKDLQEKEYERREKIYNEKYGHKKAVDKSNAFN